VTRAKTWRRRAERAARRWPFACRSIDAEACAKLHAVYLLQILAAATDRVVFKGGTMKVTHKIIGFEVTPAMRALFGGKIDLGGA
jgi:hypothetical protein